MNYLSPSSFLKYKFDRGTFVQTYILGNWPEREQSMPMLVGTGFDAIVKAELSGANAEACFKLEVPEDLWAEVWPAAQEVMTAYKEQGAYDDLRRELDSADTVSFQAEQQHSIMVGETVIPFKAYPDCYYRKGSALTILDWKVNGYGSPHKRSPHKYYFMDWSKGKAHPKYEEGVCFSSINDKWAIQIMIYYWLLQNNSDYDPLASFRIDQALINPTSIRCISYRSGIDKPYWDMIQSEIETAWKGIQEGNPYPDQPNGLEELERVKKLNQVREAHKDLLNLIKGAKNE